MTMAVISTVGGTCTKAPGKLRLGAHGHIKVTSGTPWEPAARETDQRLAQPSSDKLPPAADENNTGTPGWATCRE